MRVLHVNKFLYRRGGAECYMLDLATLQAARGDVVAFFGTEHLADDALPFAGRLAPYVELNPPPRGVAPRVSAAAGMVWNRDAERRMAAALDAFSPDVVHLHNIYHQLSPSILRPLRRRDVRVVMTLHDYKLACPTYLMTSNGRPCDACLGGHFSRALTRQCREGDPVGTALMVVESTVHRRLRSYDRVDTLICPSRFMLDTMRTAGVFPDRLQHVPHPVDVPAVAKDRPGGDILYTGRLSPEKGCDVLIQAVGQLAAEGRPWHLTFAGDGPDRASLEAAARDLAPGQVTFTGRVDKAEIGRLLQRAAVAVVPSRCNENQPLAVLEALAAGVPVVATSLGGIPELIRPGQDGWLVPPDSPSALAEAVDTAMAYPALTCEMGRAGRHRVAQEFDAATHLAALNRLYLGGDTAAA